MATGSFNETLFIPVIIGTFLFSSLTIGLVTFIWQYKRAQKKFDWELQQHKQALLQTEIEIREQTLSHISRELHDNLGQVASLIKINLNLVSDKIPGEDRRKIEESKDLLKSIITSIKELSLSLNRDSVNRLGLVDSISADVLRINRAGQFQVVLKIGDGLPELSPDVEIFLYRMCQEGLNNAVKHSGATEVLIDLNYANDHFQITITDNGKGFDTSGLHKPSKGSGLHNIFKRCELIGAQCSINSQPNNGTRIIITLPILNKHGKQKG